MEISGPAGIHGNGYPPVAAHAAAGTVHKRSDWRQVLASTVASERMQQRLRAAAAAENFAGELNLADFDSIEAERLTPALVQALARVCEEHGHALRQIILPPGLATLPMWTQGLDLHWLELPDFRGRRLDVTDCFATGGTLRLGASRSLDAIIVPRGVFIGGAPPARKIVVVDSPAQRCAFVAALARRNAQRTSADADAAFLLFQRCRNGQLSLDDLTVQELRALSQATVDELHELLRASGEPLHAVALPPSDQPLPDWLRTLPLAGGGAGGPGAARQPSGFARQ